MGTTEGEVKAVLLGGPADRMVRRFDGEFPAYVVHRTTDDGHAMYRREDVWEDKYRVYRYLGTDRTWR